MTQMSNCAEIKKRVLRNSSSVVMAVGFCLLLSSTAYSQAVSSTSTLAQQPSLNTEDSTNTSAVTLEEKAQDDAKKWGLVADLSYTSNMHDRKDYNHSSSSALLLSTSYKWTQMLTSSLRGSITQEFDHAEETKVSDLRLRTTYKTAEITPEITWSNRLDMYAPISRKSQLNDKLRFAAGVGSVLSYKNTNEIAPFTLTGVLSLIRNFHEYDVKSNGSPNLEYNLAQGLTFSADVTDKVSFDIAGTYYSALTYNDSERYTFDSSISLGYQITEPLNVYVELANGGNALKSNGVDSNISFLDEKSSELSVGLTYEY
ncbi:MAG: hypothetical protein ACK41T_07860 [Pseudobdellovibrio sp.]